MRTQLHLWKFRGLMNRTEFEQYIGRFAKSRKPRRADLESKREVVKEWGSPEETQKVDIADQIGQLNALRFKMKSGRLIYRSQIEKFPGERNTANAGRNSERRNAKKIWDASR